MKNTRKLTSLWKKSERNKNDESCERWLELQRQNNELLRMQIAKLKDGV